MPAVDAHSKAILKAMDDHANAGGREMARKVITSAKPLLAWLRHLEEHQERVCAEELLLGARAAVLESATYLSLGLGRAAITAIRCQIELTIGFTYFGCHPDEWNRLNETGDGFFLTSPVYEYHKENRRGFTSRWDTIEKVFKLKIKDLYGVLSAHVHGQSRFTIPRAGAMEEFVLSQKFNASIVEIQQQTAQALSNFLLALYADEWAALPAAILEPVLEKFDAQQRHRFFVESFRRKA